MIADTWPAACDVPNPTYHGRPMRSSRAIIVGVAALLAVAATSPAIAANPTPVPAPLVDLDESTSAPSASPSPSTTTEPQFSPSPSASAATEPVLGGPRLGQTRGTVVDLSGGAKELPDVKARTWVLADATTGEVLAAKKAHKLRRPASTLKTLTALTLLPELDPQATWTGTATAANAYGSKAGIRKGQLYTVDQLFYGLLLPSGNDAAIALAQANSSVAKTVRQMNDVAKELQAYNTTARNTSGLDAPGQFSTAYDLALIARAALARGDFREYVGAKTAKFPNPRKKRNKPITLYNQNDLVMKNYKGAVGVKTGYTSKAGRTFIGAAERGGTTLIVTLMGIQEPSDEAAKKLLNWGFKNREKIQAVGELVPPQAEETVIQADVTISASPAADISPAASVAEDITAAPANQSFASLSPTAWGWLAVFVAAGALALVAVVRWVTSRRRRRLIS